MLWNRKRWLKGWIATRGPNCSRKGSRLQFHHQPRGKDWTEGSFFFIGCWWSLAFCSSEVKLLGQVDAMAESHSQSQRFSSTRPSLHSVQGQTVSKKAKKRRVVTKEQLQSAASSMSGSTSKKSKFDRIILNQQELNRDRKRAKIKQPSDKQVKIKQAKIKQPTDKQVKVSQRTPLSRPNLTMEQAVALYGTTMKMMESDALVGTTIVKSFEVPDRKVSTSTKLDLATSIPSCLESHCHERLFRVRRVQAYHQGR